MKPATLVLADPKKILVVLLGTIIGIMGMLATIQLLSSPHTGWADFRQIYSGIEAFAAGTSPYDQTGYLNPLWWAIILLPLTNLGYTLAAEIWFWLNLVILLGTVGILTSRWPHVPRLIALLGAIAFAPSLNTLIHGQVSFIVLLGATLPILKGRRWQWLAIFSLLLLTIKPHLGIPIAGLILFMWIRSRQLKLVTISLASIAALIFLTLLVRPVWIAEWLGSLGGGGPVTASAPVIGLILGQWLPPTAAWLIHGIVGVPILIGIGYWLYKCKPPMPAAIAYVCPASLILTPYAHSYDLALLLPAIIYLCSMIMSEPNRFALSLPVLAIFLVPMGQFVGALSETSMVTLPIGVMVILIATAFISKSHEKKRRLDNQRTHTLDSEGIFVQ